MNIKLFLLLTVLLLLLCVTSAHADGAIRGFVLDKTSGEPLPVANVLVVGTERGAATNLDGYFHIPALPSGMYTLKVSYLGFNTAEFEVKVNGSETTPVNLELLPAGLSLEEVVYTQSATDDDEIRKSARVSTIPVDANTIRSLPALGAEVDVMRAMQAIPGVKASSDISSALYVRGGNSAMTLIQMDQSTVYNPSHLFGMFSTFNGDAVKHIQLMKGGFPAEYGSRAGSVLEVVTNDGNRKKNEGVVSLGIVSTKMALEGPLPKGIGSYAVSGRRTYFDGIVKALESSGVEDLPNYYFYDGNGKVNLDVTPKTTLTLGGYLGLDKLTYEFSDTDSPIEIKTHWGNKTSTARLRQVTGDHSYVTLGYSFSRYASGFAFENEGETVQEFKNRFNEHLIRTDFEYFGLVNHTIKSGIEARRYSVDVLNQTEDVVYMDIDDYAWNISHYIQDSWKIGAQWEVMPGLRWSWHEKGEQVKLEPRFSTVYHYNPQTRFKLALGRYYQWIEVVSSGDAASFLDIWMPNDGTVEPMYADQIVLGIEHDPVPGLEFTFESYYNDLHNVNEFNMAVDRGTTMKDVTFIGEGYAYGFEFMLRKKAGRLTGWLGYSLAWTKRRFPGSNVNFGNWYYPRWDRRHDFIAVGTYALSEKWDMSAQWRYNTGQGYTRAMAMYTQHLPGVKDDMFPDANRRMLYGAQNNYRFPADHRLDVTFTYNHHFFKLPAKLNMSVYNVYSRRSIWFLSYDNDTNPVEVEKVKLLPIIPLLSYEVRF